MLLLDVTRKHRRAASVITGRLRHLAGGLVLIAFAVSGTAVSATLDGKVLGSDARPKPFVRVEIGGPDVKTVFSGPHGEFHVELSHGHYVVQVYEHNRGAKFEVDVPRDDSAISKKFRVGW